MSLSTPVAVALKKDPEITGVIVDICAIKMKNASGLEELVIRNAVCWEAEHMRSPCPSFHAPEELVFLGCPLIDAAFEDEEDEDEFGEEGEEEAVEETPASGEEPPAH